MKITWFGTANLKVQDDQSSIHFDPYLPSEIRLNYCTDWPAEVAEQIFITHGHFDHLMDIPELMCKGDYLVNCSDVAAENLISRSVDKSRINVICAGQRIRVGSIEVHVMKGCHSRAGLRLILKTFLNYRVITRPGVVRELLKQHLAHPCGPVFAYHVTLDGKEILHLGSMDIDPETRYPENVDLLMLPYQGCSDLLKQAMKIIKRIKPRSILLHHFDDSFPPISRNVDTSGFINIMKNEYPAIPVYSPRYNEVLNF